MGTASPEPAALARLRHDCRATHRMTMIREVPPPEALAAFGARDEAVPLPGGQGRTWRADGIVLKPAGLAAEATWAAEVLSALEETERFRVARPVRAADGEWVVSGWQAWRFTPGHPDARRW